MEFLKNVGESFKDFSEKAKEVGRKPGELVELTKFKYEYSKLTKVIANNMDAIGELVFRQYKGEMGLEAEIEGLLQSSKSIEAEMLKIEQQIETMQPKTLTCPQCKTELPDEAVYCFKCGQKVGQEKD